MLLNILCDFDGTVSTVDTADVVFSSFCPPAWHDIEARWEAGEIGSAECMRQQIELMDVSLPELHRCLDEIEIDPTFPRFVSFCAEFGLELTIVSDGMDYFIRRILGRHGLKHLAIKANHFVQRGPKSYALMHPYKVKDCAAGSGTCKCACLQKQSPTQTVMIGDGRSDFCVSHEADIVFAKKSLLTYTQQQNITASAYTSFSEIETALRALMAAQAPSETTCPTSA